MVSDTQPVNGPGTVLVTGATGNVGRFVVESLTARMSGAGLSAAEASNAEAATAVADGSGPTVVAASTSCGSRRFPAGVRCRRLDFLDPSTWAPAFAGVDSLFLMRPPAVSDVRGVLVPLVDAAIAAGVSHIVFLSLLGVDRNRITPHYKTERYIASTGVPYTFLRPSFFNQNFDTTHRREIQEDGELFVPVGRARTSFIDTRDIGAVAARVIAEGARHYGRSYDLTGPEALDYREIAAIFTDVLGREVRYADPSPIRFYLRKRRDGIDRGFAFVMTALYTATRFGSGEAVTDEVARLLERPPIPFRRYVEDYRAAFLPADVAG